VFYFVTTKHCNIFHLNQLKCSLLCASLDFFCEANIFIGLKFVSVASSNYFPKTKILSYHSINMSLFSSAAKAMLPFIKWNAFIVQKHVVVAKECTLRKLCFHRSSQKLLLSRKMHIEICKSYFFLHWNRITRSTLKLRLKQIFIYCETSNNIENNTRFITLISRLNMRSHSRKHHNIVLLISYH
jgi:hypothetical protein